MPRQVQSSSFFHIPAQSHRCANRLPSNNSRKTRRYPKTIAAKQTRGTLCTKPPTHTHLKKGVSGALPHPLFCLVTVAFFFRITVSHLPPAPSPRHSPWHKLCRWAGSATFSAERTTSRGSFPFLPPVDTCTPPPGHRTEAAAPFPEKHDDRRTTTSRGHRRTTFNAVATAVATAKAMPFGDDRPSFLPRHPAKP
jgi:hypothetical protein